MPLVSNTTLMSVHVLLSALILLLVVNLSLEMDFNFLYDKNSFTIRRCLSPNCGDFSLRKKCASVIFVNENENGEKRENNEFVNEN